MSDSTSPTVSVILPAYNAEAFIEETVGSITAQTYTDYEIIAVNDGSSDRTGEILDRLAAATPQMRVIHQENQGLAKARNNAIAQMKGQYIALQDADDLWLPEKLEKCLAFLTAHPDLSIVYTPMAPFDGKTGERMTGHSKPCQAGWLAEKLFMSIFVHDPASVFHRRIIETCGGFCEEIPVSVGHEFWLRVSPHFAFGVIDEPLALRRWTEESLTRRNRLRGRRIKARLLEEFFDKYRDAKSHDDPNRPLVDPIKARRRLAKVNYHAGKLLLQQRQCRQARPYLKKALHFHPGYLKVYAFYLAALLPLGEKV
jgi:glycosyltransferase involved in cell wall biosynthesis